MLTVNKTTIYYYDISVEEIISSLYMHDAIKNPKKLEKRCYHYLDEVVTFLITIHTEQDEYYFNSDMEIEIERNNYPTRVQELIEDYKEICTNEITENMKEF